MENISKFLISAATLGVPESDLFSSVDLFEAKDMSAVVRGVHSLGRIVQKIPGYEGPVLKTKPARLFSAEKLLMAKNAVTFVGLGSRGGSRSVHVIAPPAAQPKGGAEASRTEVARANLDEDAAATASAAEHAASIVQAEAQRERARTEATRRAEELACVAASEATATLTAEALAKTAQQQADQIAQQREHDAAIERQRKEAVAAAVAAHGSGAYTTCEAASAAAEQGRHGGHATMGARGPRHHRAAHPPVVNTARYEELAKGLLEARRSRAHGRVRFHAWQPSVALGQTRSAATGPFKDGKPSSGGGGALLEIQISYHGLALPAPKPGFGFPLVSPRGSPPCRPIALILSGTPSAPSTLLGVSEWQDAAESSASGAGAGIAGTFETLLVFDAASLPLGPRAQLRLQLRHVPDPFWDAAEAASLEALLAMPLLGQATFPLTAALGSSARHEALVLPLDRVAHQQPAHASGAVGPAAELAATVGGSALVRTRHVPGFPPRGAGAHAIVNYAWPLRHAPKPIPARLGLLVGVSVPPSPSRGRGVPPPRLREPAPLSELRVSEHGLPCPYGLLVPLQTLAMLIEVPTRPIRERPAIPSSHHCPHRLVTYPPASSAVQPTCTRNLAGCGSERFAAFTAPRRNVWRVRGRRRGFALVVHSR